MSKEIKNNKYAVRRIIALIIISALLTSSLILLLSNTTPGTLITITVAPTESLWALAEVYGNPNGDPRDWIYEVIELNSLTDSTLMPGQTLIVPDFGNN
jgi:hypothetical protein